MAFRIDHGDTSTRPEDTTSEIAQLLVEQGSSLGHCPQTTNVELILEYIEKNGRKPV